MSPALQQLRDAMQRGEVLLCTRQRDILAADLVEYYRFTDVTATVWNPATAAWHQHFVEQLDEASFLLLLALAGTRLSPAEPISLH